jgi:hypothetical protein
MNRSMRHNGAKQLNDCYRSMTYTADDNSIQTVEKFADITDRLCIGEFRVAYGKEQRSMLVKRAYNYLKGKSLIVR